MTVGRREIGLAAGTQPTTEDREPARYELRIGAHLDDHWAAWFGGSTLTRESDGTTTLRCPVVDQTALHGLLDRIRDLGLSLISVQAVDGPRCRRSQTGPGDS